MIFSISYYMACLILFDVKYVSEKCIIDDS